MISILFTGAILNHFIYTLIVKKKSILFNTQVSELGQIQVREF
ncbi:hypothetical protein [Methylomonas fluvii]|nr:hypothetical protein [Methylomonas fluvii]